MTDNNPKNFSELYRAAFAERDPDRKVELLGQVRRAIDEWEQMLQNWVNLGDERKQPEAAAGQGFGQVA